LISPLSIDALPRSGLTVEGFEKRHMTSERAKSDCSLKPKTARRASHAPTQRAAVAVAALVPAATRKRMASGTFMLRAALGLFWHPCACKSAGGWLRPGSPEHARTAARRTSVTSIDWRLVAARVLPVALHDQLRLRSGYWCAQDATARVFGRTRAQRVCGKPSCELGRSGGGAAMPAAPGPKCACVNGGDAKDPIDTCPSGEVVSTRASERSLGRPRRTPAATTRRRKIRLCWPRLGGVWGGGSDDLALWCSVRVAPRSARRDLPKFPVDGVARTCPGCAKMAR